MFKRKSDRTQPLILSLTTLSEAEGFHVVYFESSQDLEMADVDIGEVLLAIARQISQSLTDIALVEPRRLRERLNRYLGPQKNQLVDAINQELIEPAIASLKAIGKNGLVVIVDNLDRLDSRPLDEVVADCGEENRQAAQQAAKTTQEAAQIAQNEAQEGTRLEREGTNAIKEFAYQPLNALVAAMEPTHRTQGASGYCQQRQL
ncbi:MAG: hypothetical protein RH949_19000 [Coleofasciculus sp. A1-SPW-01]|uniref:hypothetical protein n=1 Tax=Coleofasciculus sp. A1-SPW-01 TaxID=3070819 RepID=UPI0032F0CDE6